MQNLVSKTRDAIEVNALGTGPDIVEHHGQSVIGLTEAASHLPLQYTTTDHEEQDQLARQVDGEVYKEHATSCPGSFWERPWRRLVT